MGEVWYRKIRIKTKSANILVLRELLDPSFGLYLWSSALVLTLYLNENIEIVKGRVLELGSGLGLCGLFLAQNGCSVTLTDSRKYPKVLENLEFQVEANKLSASAKVSPLDWGVFDDEQLSLMDSNFNYIIASDVFYEPRDFEDLISTIYCCLIKSPGAKFITAYQERSSTRCIDVLLERWGLEARIIDFYNEIEIYSEIEQAFEISVGKQLSKMVVDPWNSKDLASVVLIELFLKKSEF